MSAPRVYRTALWLYPTNFRREFGADLDQAYSDLRRDCGAFATWRRCTSDLFWSVPTRHLEERMERISPAAIALSGGALIAAAVVAAALFGYPVFAIAPLLAGAVGVVVYRRSQTPYREAVRESGRLWSWFLGSGLGVLGVIVAASKLHDNWNWFPWELLVVSILLGWTLIATGMLLGIIHLVRRFGHHELV